MKGSSAGPGVRHPRRLLTLPSLRAPEGVACSVASVMGDRWAGSLVGWKALLGDCWLLAGAGAFAAAAAAAGGARAFADALGALTWAGLLLRAAACTASVAAGLCPAAFTAALPGLLYGPAL